MPKILVTGGMGFIGSSLVRQLVAYSQEHSLNLEIRTMDIMRPEIPAVQCLQGSVLDITDLSKAARDCDYIVHLAALLGVRNSETRRLDCLNINIMGTLNVLNAAIQDRVKKIVFASSSEVYGDQQIFPIKETNPVNPKSVYAVSKLAGEEYVRAYGLRYGIKYSILRFFNVYGPGQVGEFVVPRFVMAVQNGEPPAIYGDGQQKRAFCYVDDVANGIVKALFSDKANGETINLGNNTEVYSILEVAQKAIKASGRSGLEPRFTPAADSDRTPEREVYERVPDISKAQQLLGFSPTSSLDTGLQKMFDYGAVVPTWTR
jgi:UDP-glucose 4-epimerase